MKQIVEVTIPVFPECWSSCGNCGRGEVTVDDVPMAEGSYVERDETILVLETGKVALDIPSPCRGEVVAILVKPGDRVEEREVVMLLET
ncbi:biotin/lipoyl-containing protein [Formivibrio citricus]|nr:biotin/lipoyl-containing protein [Formivibrio citricus]